MGPQHTISIQLEVENDIQAFDCIYAPRIGHEAAMFLEEEVAFHAMWITG